MNNGLPTVATMPDQISTNNDMAQSSTHLLLNDAPVINRVPTVATMPGQIFSNNDMTQSNTPSSQADSQMKFNDAPESMTALARCRNAVNPLRMAQVGLQALLVVYAICISGIFALFANKRAEGSVPLSVLFSSSSFFYNIFGALMFGKRVGSFLSESLKRAKQKDGIYLSFWFVSLALAGMTAMAGVKVSDDSVSSFHHQAIIKTAVSMFVFNTLSTRWAGGLDLLEKIHKEIRYLNFDRFFQDWKKYNGATLVSGFMPNQDISYHEQLVSKFYKELADQQLSISLPKEAAFYASKVVKTFSGVVSLALLPMWISLTASGLRAIDADLEKSAPFTIACAVSNLPFYFMSCFNLYPNSKDLLLILHKKWNGQNRIWRNAAVCFAFLNLVGLSIVSGAGYAMEVKNMEKNGFGKTAHDLFPDVFFTAMRSFASYFAMVIAGLVNFSVTAKFFVDIFKLQVENPGVSFLKAMALYMNFVSHSTGLTQTALESSVGSVFRAAPDTASEVEADTVHSQHSVAPLAAFTGFECEKLVIDMKAAIAQNQFVEGDKSKLFIDGYAIGSDAIVEGRATWKASMPSYCCASLFAGSNSVSDTSNLHQASEGLLSGSPV